MPTIKTTVDGYSYTVDVDDVGSIERMRIASRVPEELEKLAEMTEEEAIESMNASGISEETIMFLTDVTTQTTDFTEDELDQLPINTFIQLTTDILNEIFTESNDSMKDKKRVRRVRCSREYIDTLFTEKMSMICGMPDDASMVDFNYDPSRQEVQFIFESSEWKPIKEGAKIPTHEAYAVGLGDSTKELSSSTGSGT